jgi:hypothetical protein
MERERERERERGREREKYREISRWSHERGNPLVTPASTVSLWYVFRKKRETS